MTAPEYRHATALGCILAGNHEVKPREGTAAWVGPYCRCCGTDEDVLIEEVTITLRRRADVDMSEDDNDAETTKVMAICKACPGTTVRVHSTDGVYLYTPQGEE